jgi:hypothetical protein
VTVFGAILVVAGAGFATARTSSGPPWAQEPDETLEEMTGEERAEVEAAVEEFFAAAGVEGECRAELLGGADAVEGALGDDATVQAIGALVTAFESDQTSHGVQGMRSVMENCADHANDGLRNAVYHHGLNWIRHYEHEQWLREKFENKWPDGKPGGNPHVTSEVTTDDGDGVGNGQGKGHGKDHGNGHGNGMTHGNPHVTTDATDEDGPGNSNGNGNAYGHSK